MQQSSGRRETRATDKAVARGWRKEDETPGREKKNLGVRGVALVRLGRRVKVDSRGRSPLHALLYCSIHFGSSSRAFTADRDPDAAKILPCKLHYCRTAQHRRGKKLQKTQATTIRLQRQSAQKIDPPSTDEAKGRDRKTKATDGAGDVDWRHSR
ncbi:hypothetical protein BJX62DRAFT_202839 [Aspergillus germanicus]